MVRWQAVVFDLDDTLYPERDYIQSGFQAVATWAETRLGIPAIRGYDELCQLYHQGVRGNTFDRWLSQYHIDPTQWVSALVEQYRVHVPTIAAYPDIIDLLRTLQQTTKLGVVSDGYLAVQKRKFNALALSVHFAAVVFSDEWGREAWKPSSIPFRFVLQRLSVEPHSAVYIGDNPLKDFIGARQLGMATIWLRRPLGEYSHLEPPTAAHAPHYMVEDVTTLTSLLMTE